MNFLLWMLLTSASVLMLATATPAATWESDDGKQAQALLEEILRMDKGVGAMAAIVKDGKLVWSGTAGYADLEAGIKMRTNHRLRIGSVSKPFTAVLSLRLAELKKLDLDSSIAKHLDSKEDLKGVSPRLLGSHLAGIRHYDFINLAEANNVYYFSSLKASMSIFRRALVVDPPDSRFRYSSIGFNLIGVAIEGEMGNSFGESLTTYVTKPLGLENTMIDESIAVVKERARFYTIGNPNPLFPWMKKDQVMNTFFRDSSDYYPSGGILSNAEDLARFAHIVFDTETLSRNSKKMLTNPATTSDGKKAQYKVGPDDVFYSFGWGIQLNADGSVKSFRHNGTTNGAYALVRYFPKEKIAVGAIVNYNIVAGGTALFEIAGNKIPALFESQK